MIKVIRSALAVLVVAGWCGAAWGDPQADELKAKMTETYKGLKTYQATTHLERKQQIGRWTEIRATDYRIALDRDGGKLLVDAPDFLLVSDGTKVRVKSDQIHGRHLEINTPKPLNYEALAKQVPFVSRPLMPDLMLLLADNPASILSEGKSATTKVLPPDPADAQKRPGIQVAGAEGSITLRLDPATWLVNEVIVETTGKAPDDPAQEPDGPSRVTYRVDIQKIGQPSAAATFTMDTTGSTAAASLQAYLQEGGLEGQPAPAVEIKTIDGKDFKLADEKAEVVVLNFWSTWAPPCRKELPEIQKVAEWVKAEKKPVAIYVINLREKPEQAKEFCAKMQLTMSVLMDSDAKAADAYGIEAIPQTVVIHKGTVVQIIRVLRPNESEEQVLKNKIEELLSGK